VAENWWSKTTYMDFTPDISGKHTTSGTADLVTPARADGGRESRRPR
jgi:hypothetical protein